MAPLDRGDDDVERAQRALHLEPLHAAPARAVGGAGVLDHEALVPALARGQELAVQSRDQVLAAHVEGRLPREEHRRGEGHRPKDHLALREGLVQKYLAVALEHVEEHERRGQPLPQLPRDILPTEACLERREGNGALRRRVEAEDLGVEHVRAGHRGERVEQLGVALRHAIERPRVQLDAVAILVHLRADAVVLVLDHVRRREALLDLRQIEHRRREHHSDRREMRERRLFERAVLRAQRRLADVAGEHVRARDGLALAAEGLCDRVLEQSLAQADTRLTADDLRDVPRLTRGRTADHGPERVALGVRAAKRRDRREARGDVGERQRIAPRRGLADELVRDVTKVGVALVALAHVVGGLARPLQQDVRQGRPAHIQDALVLAWERRAGEEPRRDDEIVILQTLQIGL